MTDRTQLSLTKRVLRFAAVPAIAGALVFGGASQASAGLLPIFEPEEGECQADRSNHLLGGLLTDELTFVSDLLPFTIAGEQYPVCE